MMVAYLADEKAALMEFWKDEQTAVPLVVLLVLM